MNKRLRDEIESHRIAESERMFNLYDQAFALKAKMPIEEITIELLQDRFNMGFFDACEVLSVLKRGDI